MNFCSDYLFSIIALVGMYACRLKGVVVLSLLPSLIVTQNENSFPAGMRTANLLRHKTSFWWLYFQNNALIIATSRSRLLIFDLIGVSFCQQQIDYNQYGQCMDCYVQLESESMVVKFVIAVRCVILPIQWITDRFYPYVNNTEFAFSYNTTVYSPQFVVIFFSKTVLKDDPLPH